MNKKIAFCLYYLGGFAVVILGAYTLEQVVVWTISGDKTAYAIPPISATQSFDQAITDLSLKKNRRN